MTNPDSPDHPTKDHHELEGRAPATTHPGDLLAAAVERTGSMVCVGLDPRPALVPPEIRRRALNEHGDSVEAVAAAFTEYNRIVLDTVAPLSAAVKFQTACYEAYGSVGWRCLEESVLHARSLGLVVIADAKRSDIGSTMTQYAQAFFGGAEGLAEFRHHGLGAHWLTCNGYLGSDGVDPVLEAGGGAFVLVRTSNPSSRQVQELRTADGSVAEQLARLVHSWGVSTRSERGETAVGAVVGATWPQDAASLRRLMPDTWFLVPGYGTQGGSADDSLAGLRGDGSGVLVNSSRAVLGAWIDGDEHRWQAAVHKEVADMHAALIRSATRIRRSPG